MTNELLYEHHKYDALTYDEFLKALSIKYQQYYELDFVPNKDDMIDYVVNSNLQYFTDDYSTEVRTIEFSKVGKAPEVITFNVKDIYDDDGYLINEVFYID